MSWKCEMIFFRKITWQINVQDWHSVLLVACSGGGGSGGGAGGSDGGGGGAGKGGSSVVNINNKNVSMNRLLANLIATQPVGILSTFHGTQKPKTIFARYRH
jgi:hypothetical protein